MRCACERICTYDLASISVPFCLCACVLFVLCRFSLTISVFYHINTMVYSRRFFFSLARSLACLSSAVILSTSNKSFQYKIKWRCWYIYEQTYNVYQVTRTTTTCYCRIIYIILQHAFPSLHFLSLYESVRATSIQSRKLHKQIKGWWWYRWWNGPKMDGFLNLFYQSTWKTVHSHVSTRNTRFFSLVVIRVQAISYKSWFF